MRVAGIQLDIAWEDPDENFARADALIDAAGDTDLIVLPEMFATGFSMDAERCADRSGDIRRFLSDAARRRGVWVLAGFVEPTQAGCAKPSNAAALYNREGLERGRYSKQHLFTTAGEDEHYEAGTEFDLHDVDGVGLAPFICYDLRFPGAFRLLAEQTDLFCVIANWPASRRVAWDTLLRARAIENQAYVLGVNRVGSGGGEDYDGGSVLWDPLGEMVAEAGEDACTVEGEIDPGHVAEVRRRWPFLADRLDD